MSDAQVVLAAVATPFAGAALIALAHRWPNLRETVTLATAAVLFALVLSLFDTVGDGARPAMTVVEIMPGLGIHFAAEPLGVLFATVSSLLWILTSVYSIGYMRANDERHQTRYYAYFAIALGCAAGVAFAADIFTLFVFYEGLTLSTYPLVTHAGTPEARRGGRTYLGLLLGTSIGLMLLAIIWTWLEAGTLAFQPGGIFAGQISSGLSGLLLVLYVFGIGKAALMPLHRWLPAAMVAPAPVSALLHAVAVVKAGVFAVLKVAVYLFGIEHLSGLTSGRWLIWVAAATIVIASIVAIRQDDLKRRLAYSTVSQLSYIVLGALLATGAGVLGAGMHIATHAFGKITLFFCAGAIYTAARVTKVSDMRGLARAMPLTMTAFVIGSLSVIGLPPMGGVWSKWYLVVAALDAGETALLAVILGGSLLSAGYLMPPIVSAFFAAPRDAAGGGAKAELKEAPLPCLIALSLTAAGCVVLFLFPNRLADLARAVDFGGG